MAERYCVRLDRGIPCLHAPPHFITFGGNVLRTPAWPQLPRDAEVEGPLDENHYVVDFIALRDALKTVTERLDHFLLLPTETR